MTEKESIKSVVDELFTTEKDLRSAKDKVRELEHDVKHIKHEIVKMLIDRAKELALTPDQLKNLKVHLTEDLH